MLAVLTAAVEHARAGGGPVLVEAHTYRMDAHTNADDATRYRDDAEVERVARADPVARLETYLRARGAARRRRPSRRCAEEAEALAADLRDADERRTRRSTRWTCSTTSTPSRRRNCASSGPSCAAELEPPTQARTASTTDGRKPATMAQALNAALRDALARGRPACSSSARTSARSAASSASPTG